MAPRPSPGPLPLDAVATGGAALTVGLQLIAGQASGDAVANSSPAKAPVFTLISGKASFAYDHVLLDNDVMQLAA